MPGTTLHDPAPPRPRQGVRTWPRATVLLLGVGLGLVMAFLFGQAVDEFDSTFQRRPISVINSAYEAGFDTSERLHLETDDCHKFGLVLHPSTPDGPPQDQVAFERGCLAASEGLPRGSGNPAGD